MHGCESLTDRNKQKGMPKSDAIIPPHSTFFPLLFFLSFFFFVILIFLFHLHSCFDLGMVLLWQLSDGDCPLTSHYERSWTFRRNKLNFKHHSHESEETTCHYLVLGRQWVGKTTTCAQSSVSTPNKVRPSWDDQRLLSPKLAYGTWKSAVIQRSESHVSLKYFIRSKT